MFGIVHRPYRAGLALAVGLLSAMPAGATLPAMPFQIPLAPGARAALESRAQAGDKTAQRALSEINTEWAGERPDYVAALYWYERAKANPAPATDDYRFRGLSDGDADLLRAFNAEHAALFARAQTGDAKALTDFAWHTPHKASGVAGDDQMAHWILLAARAGDHIAQAQIGYFYYRAFYVRGDRAYHDATTNAYNDAEAAREKIYAGALGDVSERLRDDEPLGFDEESATNDVANAIFWFGKAAESGDTRARYNLGLAYAIKGPTRDWVAASRWLHEALYADPTLPVTACDLDLSGDAKAGPEYEGGATPQLATAFACYDRVKAHHPGAYYMLGYLLHHGVGVPRDDARARGMLQKAATYSDWRPRAMNELSHLYRDSPTLARDKAQAVVWLARALVAPETPRTYCGMLGPQDDKGGPLAPQAFGNDADWGELNTLYQSLSPAQKVTVRTQLKRYAPDLQVGPAGFIAPMLYLEPPCV